MYPIEARTALGAAFIRASHLEVHNKPYVFNDHLATALLTQAEKNEFRERFAEQYNNWTKKTWFQEAKMTVLEDDFLGYMRTSPLVPEILARQAYAESFISSRSNIPINQYAILGAGLDTFALRNSDSNLKVYEIDRKIMVDFKKQRLVLSGFGRKDRYRSVSVDFESEDLAERLKDSGFSSNVPSVVSLLGVTPYLTFEGIENTFGALNNVLCPSSVVVFDYTLPEALDRTCGCPFTIELADRLAEIGEPLQISLRSEDYKMLLTRMGFNLIENLSPIDVHSRYFAGRSDGLQAAAFVCLAAAKKL